jgi:hypothetical protein
MYLVNFNGLPPSLIRRTCVDTHRIKRTTELTRRSELQAYDLQGWDASARMIPRTFMVVGEDCTDDFIQNSRVFFFQ